MSVALFCVVVYTRVITNQKGTKMNTYTNPLKYPEHNWILICKDSGKAHSYGEGVKVFRNHTEAFEERDRLITLGYHFIPKPLVQA